MMAGSARGVPSVRNAVDFSPAEFEALWDSITEFVLIECLDDKGKSQGLGILQVGQRYKSDRDGGFLTGQYVACTDAFYDYWRKNEMQASYHHFCRAPLGRCQNKVGREGVIHVQRWCAVSRKETDELLKQWGASELPALRRRLKPTEPAGPGVMTTTSKSSAPHPAAKFKETAGGMAALPAPAVSKEAETRHGEHGRRKKRRSHHRRSADAEDVRRFTHSVAAEETPDWGDEESSYDYDMEDTSHGRGHASSSKRKGSPRKSALKPKTEEAEADPKLKKRRAALDAVLDDADLDVVKEKDLTKEAELRLASLKDSLMRKKEENNKKGTGSLLAERAAEVAAKSSKKKKKKLDPVTKVLTKALKSTSRKDDDSEDESNSDSEDDDDKADDFLESGGSGSVLAGRQRKLKRLSEKNPGALMLRGYSTMHEQVGSLYGSSFIESGNTTLSPVAVRYLMTVVMPQLSERIGSEQFRELRTLTTGLDLLVQGKTAEVGDLMTQRLKSILMSVRDKTDAASKWLELLPVEPYPGVTTPGEDSYARSLAVKVAKSEALLQSMSR